MNIFLLNVVIQKIRGQLRQYHITDSKVPNSNLHNTLFLDNLLFLFLQLRYNGSYNREVSFFVHNSLALRVSL